jgi:uncharacterized protein YdcH (DUF465 family)
MTVRSFFGKLRRKLFRLILGREWFVQMTNADSKLNYLDDKINQVDDKINHVGNILNQVDNMHNQLNRLHLKMDDCISLLSTLSRDEEFVHVSLGVINWEGNFKRYFLANNMPEKIVLLKSGLDEESKTIIDLWLERLLYLPDMHLKQYYKLSKQYLDSLYTVEEKVFAKEFWEKVPQYKTDFFLPVDQYNPDTFLYHFGLKFASNKVKEYIKNKDFIDGGHGLETALLSC